MARKTKPAPLTSPKRVVEGAEQTPTRQERRLAARLKGRYAPRLGWSGRFGGRSPVEDTGTVYTGPTSQAGGIYPFLLGSGLPPRGAPSAGTCSRASWWPSTPADGRAN